MEIILENNQKGILWNIMEKYEDTYPDFSDSISRVIRNKFKEDDIITISEHIDSHLDKSDSKKLDTILGIYIGLLCFQL